MGDQQNANHTVSVTDYCTSLRDQEQNESMSTIRPGLRVRLQFDDDQTAIQTGDETTGFERAKKRAEQKTGHKLQEININMEIPVIKIDREKTAPIEETDEKPDLDSMEITYTPREISADCRTATFQPQFRSSPIEHAHKFKSLSIQTDRIDDREPNRIDRAGRKLSLSKCKQQLLKTFYYGLRLSNRLEIDRNHSLYYAITAYCLSTLKKLQNWTQFDVDLVMKNAKFCQLSENPALTPNYCVIHFGYKKVKIFNFELEHQPVIFGDLLTDNCRLYNLTKGLHIYFQHYRSCILQINNYYFTIWRKKHYYYFDTITAGHQAILANFYNLKAIITVLLKNRHYYNGDKTKFKIYHIKINETNDNFDQIAQHRDYTILNDRKATIVGDFDLNDSSFGIARNKQSAMIVIIALIYAKLILTNCWTRDTINQILILGNHTYLQLNDTNPIVVERLLQQFDIGSFIVEICLNKIRIIEELQLLNRALFQFFNAYDFGVIEIVDDQSDERFNLAIWQQRDFYYLFEPYRCGGDSYRRPIEMDGGACLTITSKIATILDIIAHNYNNNNYKFNLYRFQLINSRNRLRFGKTIEQQLLEIDKNLYKSIKSHRETVDLNDSSFDLPFTKQLEELYELQHTKRFDYYEGVTEIVTKIVHDCYDRIDRHDQQIIEESGILAILTQTISDCIDIATIEQDPTGINGTLEQIVSDCLDIVIQHENEIVDEAGIDRVLSQIVSDCVRIATTATKEMNTDRLERTLLPELPRDRCRYINYCRNDRFICGDAIYERSDYVASLPFVYLMACVFIKYYTIQRFNVEIIDTIVRYGVELFETVNRNDFGDLLIKTIKIGRIRYAAKTRKLCETNLKRLKSILGVYLNKHSNLIVITANYCCLVCANKFRYFLYDFIDKQGCFWCFNRLELLVARIIDNKKQYDTPTRKTVPKDSCSVVACNVEKLADLMPPRSRDEADRTVEVSQEMVKNYYICLCAFLLLLSVDLSIKTLNKRQHIDEIIDKGQLLFTTDGQRDIDRKKVIRNVLVNGYYFGLIVKLMDVKQKKSFIDDFRSIIGKYQFVLLEYSNRFYTICIDRHTNCYFTFDLIGDHAKWSKFTDFDGLVHYIRNDDDGRDANYRFHEFQIVSFEKVVKK